MTNEKRLIDANDLSISIFATKCCLGDGSDWLIGYRDALQAVLEQIGEQRTVDAVEVVRCAECRKYSDRHCCRSFGGGSYVPFPMKPNDFCSYGERRTDEKAERT
jgi:hypothetical protein